MWFLPSGFLFECKRRKTLKFDPNRKRSCETVRSGKIQTLDKSDVSCHFQNISFFVYVGNSTDALK